jgi:hypothetical protein
LRRHSYNILNHSKWRRIEKDLPKMVDDKLVFDDEPIYPSPPLAFHKQKFDLMKFNCTNIFSKKQKQKQKIKEVNFI